MLVELIEESIKNFYGSKGAPENEQDVEYYFRTNADLLGKLATNGNGKDLLKAIGKSVIESPYILKNAGGGALSGAFYGGLLGAGIDGADYLLDDNPDKTFDYDDALTGAGIGSGLGLSAGLSYGITTSPYTTRHLIKAGEKNNINGIEKYATEFNSKKFK